MHSLIKMIQFFHNLQKTAPNRFHLFIGAFFAFKKVTNENKIVKEKKKFEEVRNNFYLLDYFYFYCIDGRKIFYF